MKHYEQMHYLHSVNNIKHEIYVLDTMHIVVVTLQRGGDKNCFCLALLSTRKERKIYIFIYKCVK